MLSRKAWGFAHTLGTTAQGTQPYGLSALASLKLYFLGHSILSIVIQYIIMLFSLFSQSESLELLPWRFPLRHVRAQYSSMSMGSAQELISTNGPDLLFVNLLRDELLLKIPEHRAGLFTVVESAGAEPIRVLGSRLCRQFRPTCVCSIRRAASQKVRADSTLQVFSAMSSVCGRAFSEHFRREDSVRTGFWGRDLLRYFFLTPTPCS